MIDLHEALIRLEADLAELDLEWALVGGLAVSARAEPRTTGDLDIAVAVANDREAASRPCSSSRAGRSASRRTS